VLLRTRGKGIASRGGKNLSIRSRRNRRKKGREGFENLLLREKKTALTLQGEGNSRTNHWEEREEGRQANQQYLGRGKKKRVEKGKGKSRPSISSVEKGGEIGLVLPLPRKPLAWKKECGLLRMWGKRGEGKRERGNLFPRGVFQNQSIGRKELKNFYSKK